MHALKLKDYILRFILLTYGLGGHSLAQCETYLIEAQEKLKIGEYQKAINTLLYSKEVCSHLFLKEIDELILESFRLIQKERDRAIEAEAEAKSQRDLANQKEQETQRAFNTYKLTSIARNISVENPSLSLRLLEHAKKLDSLNYSIISDLYNQYEKNPGEKVFRYGFIGDIESATFSPDGKQTLVFGRRNYSADKRGEIGEEAIIYDSFSGLEIHRLRGHKNDVYHATYSCNGNLIATVSSGGTIIIWDSKNAIPLKQIFVLDASPGKVAFSSDDKLLIYVSHEGIIQQWEVGSWSLIKKISLSHSDIFDLVLSADRTILATIHNNFTVIVWEFLTGKKKKEIPIQEFYIDSYYTKESIAISPDNKKILTLTNRGTALYEISSGEMIGEFSTGNGLVSIVAYSTDGKVIAIGDKEGKISLIEESSGNQLDTITFDRITPSCIKFSPNNQQIFLANSRSARLRTWRSNQCIELFSNHVNHLGAVSFSPDGNFILSGATHLSQGDSISLWDVQTGQEIKRKWGTEFPLKEIKFSQYDNLFITIEKNEIFSFPFPIYEVSIWSLKNEEKVYTINVGDALLVNATISKDGKEILTCSIDMLKPKYKISIWDVESKKKTTLFEEEILYSQVDSSLLLQNAFTTFAFSPDKTRIYFGLAELELQGKVPQFSVIEFNLKSKKKKIIHGLHRGVINSITCSENNEFLLSGSADSTAIIWDLDSEVVFKKIKSKIGGVHLTRFSPGNQYFMLGFYNPQKYLIYPNKVAILYQTLSGKEIQQFGGPNLPIHGFTFNKDGTQILLGSNYEIILTNLSHFLVEKNYMVPYETYKSILFPFLDNSKEIEDHEYISWVLGKQSGGKMAFTNEKVAVCIGSLVILEDRLTGQKIKTFGNDSIDEVFSVAFFDKEKQIVAGSNSKIYFWDIETGRNIRTFNFPVGSIRSIAISPDNKWIFAGTGLKEDFYGSTPKTHNGYLINISTGEISKELLGHIGSIRTAVFSPDGKQILTGSADSTVILWDFNSGQVVQQFSNFHHPIRNVGFSPTGKNIIIHYTNPPDYEVFAILRPTRKPLEFHLKNNLSKLKDLVHDLSKLNREKYDIYKIWDLIFFSKN